MRQLEEAKFIHGTIRENRRLFFLTTFFFFQSSTFFGVVSAYRYQTKRRQIHFRQFFNMSILQKNTIWQIQEEATASSCLHVATPMATGSVKDVVVSIDWDMPLLRPDAKLALKLVKQQLRQLSSSIMGVARKFFEGLRFWGFPLEMVAKVQFFLYFACKCM